MFDKGLKMIREGNSDIVEITDLIKSKLNAELVYENWRNSDNVRIVFLCFEKYFFRNNSYAGLSILITESNLIQTIDLVGFGGGAGPFNLSWGADSDFQEIIINILYENGFVIA